MKFEKVIQEIEKLIKESTTDDILSRLQIQEKISGYLIFLQEEEFNFLQAYKSAYTKRKIGESEFIAKSTDGVTRAAATAAYERKELREEETEMELAVDRLRMFRLAVKDHMENMRQRTSYLRYENDLLIQSKLNA